MALETVDILVQDDEVVPQPVDGVTVRVYDSSGTTLITSGVTGAVTSGHVEFTLDGDDPPTEYQLRFSVNGGSIVSPQAIEVYSPPASAPTGANNFVITASMFTLPPATNIRLCRASGYVWGPNGKPRRGIDMHFIPCFNPLVVDDVGILGERVATNTDEDGYAQTDLLRGGEYLATIESHENIQRHVVVPDRNSININNLLFPIVVDIDFTPAGPWALAVDGELEITPVVTASDFRVLETTAADDVQYATDDPDIADVTVGASTITIRGISPGTTQLRVTRTDESIVYVPDPGIDGGVVTITVT